MDQLQNSQSNQYDLDRLQGNNLDHQFNQMHTLMPAQLNPDSRPSEAHHLPSDVNQMAQFNDIGAKQLGAASFNQPKKYLGRVSPNRNGQQTMSNFGVSPQKNQWSTKTGSSRYLQRSNQNGDTEAPELSRGQLLDLDGGLSGQIAVHQSRDFNLNSQFEDEHSGSHREGGAEDSQPKGSAQQVQQLDPHQFMSGFQIHNNQINQQDLQLQNVARQLAEHQMQQQINQQATQDDFGQGFNDANQLDSHDQNFGNIHFNPEGSPNKKQIGSQKKDTDDGQTDNIQSHDQITVEIEMIDQNQKRKSSSQESSESPLSRQSDFKNNHKIANSMQPLNLNVPSESMSANLRDASWGHSLTERVGNQLDEPDRQSLNDKQDCKSDNSAEHSNSKLNSDKISNNQGSDSQADEEDADDESASVDSIDKLQSILNEINDQCIENLKNEETDQALENLKRAEQILEDYTNEGKDVDRNMIIIVLYNQACCYQRLSMLDDCSNYLDGTIFNLQQKLLNFEDQEEEIRDMILQAEQYNQYQQDKSQQRNKIKRHAYGYGDEDDDYLDNGPPDSNPYDIRHQDQYGLNPSKGQLKNKQSYNLSSLSVHNNKAQFDDGMSAEGPQLSEQSQDFQKLNDVQEPPEHYDITDADAMAEFEASKKLSISQKLFKLRYLCKCHLQLCAVQSQLNKHKDALHHGQMASVYCQELIRNSKTLCEGYIGEILGRKNSGDKQHKQPKHISENRDTEQQDSKSSEKDLGNQLKEHYYLEDDEKLLDVLIKNCHPILTDMLKQINNFNQYNELSENSKKAQQREHDILKGLRMEIANTEFDQDLMQLIESKDQFSINFETKQNIERFKKYEAELRSKGFKGDHQLNQSALKGDIFSQLESEEKQFTKKNSKKNIGKKQNGKQFVDEVAPNQAQFDLNRSIPSKNKEAEEHDVYFKNEDPMNSSFNSVGTYGQNNQNFHAGGIGAQGYLNLRNNVKTVLVTQEEDDWIFNLNIGNVMHLQPLSTEQMNLHVDNSHELSRDAMLEKIILLTVSYFCVGTELRFLNNNSSQTDEKVESLNKSQKDKQLEMEKEKKKKKELSEMWHAQALEASARFLPSECPLVAHVITNYQKHHSPALTIIPEDQELQEDLRVVRPLNEVKNDNINYYQIIRNHLQIQRSTSTNHPKKNSKKSQEREPNTKSKSKVNNKLTTISETPEPILNNPQAIEQDQDRDRDFLNFKKSDQNIAQIHQITEQKPIQVFQQPQNIIVNDLQFDPSKDAEPFSPDTFDGEEFGKEILSDQQQVLQKQQIKYMEDKMNNFQEQSQNQFEVAQQQAETINSSGSKMAAAKSMNQLKTRKMPKSPGTLQQSLSGSNFHNTQQYKIPSGMHFMNNKQDTQRSSGKIKIKKTVGDNKSGKKESLAHRNQNTHVNVTGLTRIGSIKQRLKMMPSAKSTKLIKQTTIPKKPVLNAGFQNQATSSSIMTKKIAEQTKANQSSVNLKRKSGNNLQSSKVPQSQMNTFSSASKLITMKSISPQSSNPVSNNPSFNQAQLQGANHMSSKKNLQSAKQLKQLLNQNQKSKPPTQGMSQLRKSSASGQNNQMSIAQNIQKITQVLSQKISSMSQSLGNSSRQNSRVRQHEDPQPNEPQQHVQTQQPPQQLQHQVKSIPRNRKSSVNKTHEISSEDDGEANIDADLANDISAERPGNGPAQKIKLLHNVPKVSVSNMMIKTKASMQFPNQKQFMTLQSKNLNSQLRTGSGTRIQGAHNQFKPSGTGVQSIQASRPIGTSTNPSILNSHQQTSGNKRLSIKVVGSKKNGMQMGGTMPSQQTHMGSMNPQRVQQSAGQNYRSQQSMQQVGNNNQTRLMPSSVNNFSMQNNMYHRALLQQQQQTQLQHLSQQPHKQPNSQMYTTQ